MMRTVLQRVNADSLFAVCQTIAAGNRDSEETAILQYLQKHKPALAEPFQRMIPKGRRAILNRLAGSLLREDVLGFSSAASDLHVMDSICALNVPSLDEHWRSVIQMLHRYGLSSGAYKLYSLPRDETLVIPVGRMYAYNRIEVERPILHLGKEGIRELEHPAQLLELVRRNEQSDGNGGSEWVRLADELRNGAANLALAYAHLEHKKEQLKREASKRNAASTLEYVLARKAEDPFFDSALFFEQLCFEGHNLHPCAKTKVGMDPAGVYRYAPEFEGTIDIRIVAVKKDYCHRALMDAASAETAVSPESAESVGTAESENAFFAAQFPELLAPVEAELSERGLKAEEYTLVPVHPWQFEEALPAIYRQEIERNIVVPLRSASIPAKATSSFRTLVPVPRQGRVYCALKVAVNSQMTSTVRSISANTTSNAPKFTRLIRDILDREPAIAPSFVPVGEIAGFHFIAGGQEKDNETRILKSRNLSAVARENIESFVDTGELAIVASSLYAESPVTGKTIFAELVDTYAAATGEQSCRRAAFRFVSEYASMMLPGFLTLMVKYGIGLEGHLQNSVPVFKDGRPVRMLFRDWGGARIYEQRLVRQGLRLGFLPGSVTVAEKVEDMQNKVFYTVFQNHLGEIVLQASKHFGVDEGELWREIRRICDAVFNGLESLPELEDNVRQDKEELYKPIADHKALTRMRLVTEESGYCYASVPNPLHLRPETKEN